MNRKVRPADNIYLLLAFGMMALLFYSTSMGYEDQNVQPLLHQWLDGEPLNGLLGRVEFMYAGSEISIAANGYIGFVEFFIRKGAHFVSYFLLGLFWFLGLRNRVSQPWVTVLIAVLLTVGYASFDELRQAFHPNRTALMEDVMLDTAGAVVGIATALFTRAKGRQRKKLRFKS
ncbi:MAG: VanZ family protein [Alkalibacterium sp.]|uniref:VanZ family protein n=1 Tax=Alkalibacterium sp. TaxID=1872447 RepID=UPI003970B335